jgi:beta-glucanase (GH16 family)
LPETNLYRHFPPPSQKPQNQQKMLINLWITTEIQDKKETRARILEKSVIKWEEVVEFVALINIFVQVEMKFPQANVTVYW